MAIVYMATNLVNGNRYIGASKHSLAKRRRQHEWSAVNRRKRESMYFYAAIRKYGPSMFRWTILVSVQTADDAYDQEARIIEAMNPEYNMISGGKGFGAGFWTDERRASQSIRFRGRPLSMDMRKRLSIIGYANREQWKTYSHLGPIAVRRAVICIDDGKKYNSIAEAAKIYGVATSALNELCRNQRGRKTVGGLRFRYAEDA